MTQSDIRKMLNDLDASNSDREALKQKCHELENQVNLLQDEKANISAEFEQLQSQVSFAIFPNMLEQNYKRVKYPNNISYVRISIVRIYL